MRRRTAAMRHLVLTASFLAIAVLPFAAAWVPTVAIATPAVLGPADEEWLDNANVFLRGVSGAAGIAGPAASSSVAGVVPWYGHLDLSQRLVAAWMVGALVSMMPVAIGIREVRRIRRHARPWRQGWPMLRSACLEAGVRREVDVLLDDVGPATLGILRPVVLLPPDARRWPRGDVRRAVLHELEHIRRYDCFVRLLARVVCAVYWCHPLVWVAWRQLELEAERACDDAVVRVSEPTGYADQLVALAERAIVAGRPPLLTMASRHDLACRIVSVLADNSPRGGTRLHSVVAVGACAVVFVAAVAPLRAIRTVIPTVPDEALRYDLSIQAPPAQPRSTPLATTDAAPRVRAVGLREAPHAVASPSNGGAPAGQPGPQASPHFEVATVKLNRAGGRPVPPRVVPATGQVTITNATVGALIQDAYGVQLPSQIINIPDWAKPLRFDVVAKAGSPAPVAMLQRMLQPLLAESFKLVVHTETREMDALALVLVNPGRVGPKLRKVDDACRNVVGTTSGFARPSDGPDLSQVCGVLPNQTAGQILAHGIDLAGLATELAPSQRRPVIDRTGLTGRYDVELTWTPEAFTAAALAQRPGSTPPPGVDPSGPPLPTALQDQLGLKLESTRIGVEVLVIDRMEPLTETN